jgi:hypothetical protein
MHEVKDRSEMTQLQLLAREWLTLWRALQAAEKSCRDYFPRDMYYEVSSGFEAASKIADDADAAVIDCETRMQQELPVGLHKVWVDGTHVTIAVLSDRLKAHVGMNEEKS